MIIYMFTLVDKKPDFSRRLLPFICSIASSDRLTFFDLGALFVHVCYQNSYRPQTKLREGYVLQVFVILFTGGENLGRCPPAGTPPLAGTPPGRYTPLGRYTFPPVRYTPRAGTPRRQVPPAGTPPGSSTCWEIRATSGRYASYWNAFLLMKVSTGGSARGARVRFLYYGR